MKEYTAARQRRKESHERLFEFIKRITSAHNIFLNWTTATTEALIAQADQLPLRDQVKAAVAEVATAESEEARLYATLPDDEREGAQSPEKKRR